MQAGHRRRDLPTSSARLLLALQAWPHEHGVQVVWTDEAGTLLSATVRLR